MTAMKTLVSGVVLVGAVALSGCGPAAVEKCPKFSIAQEMGVPSAGKVTFTLSPTRDGLTYNWSTAAGTILEGQGTPKIVVEDTTPGDMVTVTTEVGGLDASCPDAGKYASATATMP